MERLVEVRVRGDRVRESVGRSERLRGGREKGSRQRED